jgi:hypothetical protein
MWSRPKPFLRHRNRVQHNAVANHKMFLVLEIAAEHQAARTGKGERFSQGENVLGSLVFRTSA